jgi:phosphoribosylanthranilate isomerase
MLKYAIYVRNVTNLSDARYCAGMGVEKIGFFLDSTMGNHLEKNQFEGIRGWISGIEIVEEYFNFPTEKIDSEWVSVIWQNTDLKTNHLLDKTIFSIDLDTKYTKMPSKGAFILIVGKQSIDSYAETIQNFCNDYKVYIGFGFNSKNIDFIYEKFKPYGFSMIGGDEIAPGLKIFDEIAEILEVIEID